jgi:Bacterial protein of unknown function (DUF899)
MQLLQGGDVDRRSVGVRPELLTYSLLVMLRKKSEKNRGERTVLTFTQEGVADRADADHHEHGWRETLDKLKTVWRMEESMSKQEGPAVPAPSMCEPVRDFEVVTKEVWDAAREELLREEKSLMKSRDRLIAKRRRLPVTKVDREYRFVGSEGETDLLGLFQGVGS